MSSQPCSGRRKSARKFAAENRLMEGRGIGSYDCQGAWRMHVGPSSGTSRPMEAQDNLNW